MFKICSILAFCNFAAPEQDLPPTQAGRIRHEQSNVIVMEMTFDRSTVADGVTTVTRPHAEFYPTSENPRALTLSAERGEYDRGNDTLRLTGGAHLVTGDGDDLLTDSVLVHIADRRLDSESEFTLTRPQMRLTGRGLRASRELRAIEILHDVTAVLLGADGAATAEIYAPDGLDIVEETIGDASISVVTIPERSHMIRHGAGGATNMEADWTRITLQRMPPDDALEPRRLEARGRVDVTDAQGSEAHGDDLLWSSADHMAVLTGRPVTVVQGHRTIRAHAASIDTQTNNARFDGDARVRIEEPDAQPVEIAADTVEAAFERVEGQDPRLVGVTARSASEALLQFGEMQVRAPSIWMSGDQSIARIENLRSAIFVRDDGTRYEIMGIGSMGFEGRTVILDGDIAMASEGEHIRAHRIAIVLNDDRTLRHMDAEGDVRFARPGEVDIECDRMIYDPTSNDAQVSGYPHARITRGDVELHVAETTVNLATNELSGSTPGGRSRLRFRPPRRTE